jgi:hypothetical protein
VARKKGVSVKKNSGSGNHPEEELIRQLARTTEDKDWGFFAAFVKRIDDLNRDEEARVKAAGKRRV